MIELVMEAATAANTIGAHDHPVLEEGNLSFPRGRYVIGFVSRDDGPSFELVHGLDGAGLISRLLRRGEARYACVVSSPRSFYRRTHLSDVPRHTIEWNPQELGEPPLFTPMILSTRTLQLVLNADRDDVHPAWDGVSIEIGKGTRLALGHVFDLRSSVMQMIRMEADAGLEGNRFRVEAQSEPFAFVVKASPTLYRYVRTARGEPTRSNIMTHVVTACFALLQKRFAIPEEWDRNLERLAEHLAREYRHRWDEDEFQPEMAAMALYPHVLPEPEGET